LTFAPFSESPSQIEVEKRRLTELNVIGGKITDRIKSSRKASGGINAAQEQNWAVQKQIKLLENRLEKCNHKYNEALTKNNDLREHINNLRRERLVYDSIYKKLEKDLQEKKKDMAGIIDICNAAYEARDAVRTTSPTPIQTRIIVIGRIRLSFACVCAVF
jgi:chromosome segregation ATPase